MNANFAYPSWRWALVLPIFISGSAIAEDKVDMAAGLSLAQSSNCLMCHSVEKKIVGPAYKEVAAKYKDDKTAEARLVEKVTKGGLGVWGQVPMPPNAHVKPEDIKTLVKWVLAH